MSSQNLRKNICSAAETYLTLLSPVKLYAPEENTLECWRHSFCTWIKIFTLSSILSSWLEYNYITHGENLLNHVLTSPDKSFNHDLNSDQGLVLSHQLRLDFNEQRTMLWQVIHKMSWLSIQEISWDDGIRKESLHSI